MLAVTSTRSQGAAVEVLQKGKKTLGRIMGMGTIHSDGWTQDMKLQHDFGWIKVVEDGKEAPAPKKEAAPKEDVTVPSIEPEKLAAQEKKIAEEKEEKKPGLLSRVFGGGKEGEGEESKTYTYADFKDMDKTELKSFVEDRKLEVDTSQRVKPLREELAKLNIPKE